MQDPCFVSLRNVFMGHWITHYRRLWLVMQEDKQTSPFSLSWMQPCANIDSQQDAYHTTVKRERIDINVFWWNSRQDSTLRTLKSTWLNARSRGTKLHRCLFGPFLEVVSWIRIVMLIVQSTSAVHFYNIQFDKLHAFSQGKSIPPCESLLDQQTHPCRTNQSIIGFV